MLLKRFSAKDLEKSRSRQTNKNSRSESTMPINNPNSYNSTSNKVISMQMFG